MEKRREATKLVQWLRKSDSAAVQTLLWLPSAAMPFYWAYLMKRAPEGKRQTLKNLEGRYPGKTFFVIRPLRNIGGLAALEPLIAANCAYAEDHGWIPVVDLKNTITIYHEAGEVGKINIWDRYYEQPCGYSLEDALSARRVIIDCGHEAFFQFQKFRYFGNPAMRERSFAIFDRYVRINAETKARIAPECERIRQGGKKLLGVVCRGTDFVGATPPEHAVPPTAAEAIEMARAVMERHGCDRVFIATEDTDIFASFQAALGEKLLYNDALRFSVQPGKYLIEYETKVKRENDRYLRGIEYLTTLTALSYCDCLIGPACGAFTMAPYRRRERELYQLIDKGEYEGKSMRQPQWDAHGS